MALLNCLKFINTNNKLREITTNEKLARQGDLITDLRLGPAVCVKKPSRVTTMRVNMCKPLFSTKREDGGGSRLSRIIVMLLGTG